MTEEKLISALPFVRQINNSKYHLAGRTISKKFINVEATCRDYFKFCLTPEEVIAIEKIKNKDEFDEFVKKIIIDSHVWACMNKSEIEIKSVKKEGF